MVEKMNVFENLYPINKSVQGASHIEEEAKEVNKKRGRKFPCQDYSFAGYILPDKTSFSTPFYFISVCDGHGSAPHFRSEKGAVYGNEALFTSIKNHIDVIANLDDTLEINSEIRKLAQSTYDSWNLFVNTDLQKNPITKEEWSYLAEESSCIKYYNRYQKKERLESIYGCTALAFVYIPLKKKWFAIQIGDGDIVIKKKNSFFEMPVPDDPKNFENKVTSLCGKNAVEDFRWKYGINEEIECAFCSSDGVYNSFDSDKKLFNLYNIIIREYCISDRGEELNTNIEKRIDVITNEFGDYLSNLSKNASKDDMSVAGILPIDPELIKSHKDAYKYLEKGKKLIDRNIDKAIKCFQYVEQNAYPEAFMYEGICWEKKSDEDKALSLFEKAVNEGCIEAKKYLGTLQCKKGIQFKDVQKFSEAFAEFKKAADNENAEASYWLSMMYIKPKEFGDCIKQNVQLFFKYLKVSAENNFPEAQYKLAMCYKSGSFGPKNSQKAELLFEKAINGNYENTENAKKELSDIQIENALICKSKGDIQKSFSFFEKAANNGNPRAYYYLFQIELENGNDREAWNHLQSAQAINNTETEYKDAKYNLAKSLAISSPIKIERDIDKAECIFNEIIDYKDSRTILANIQFEKYKDLKTKDQNKALKSIIISGGIETKNNLKNIQLNKPFKKSIFSFFKKENQKVDQTQEATKKETPQFVPEQKANHTMTLNTSITGVNHNQTQKISKLPTSEQLYEAENNLHKRIVNTIQELDKFAEKSEITEVAFIRENLCRMEKELNATDLDKNKKVVLVTKVQHFLEKANSIIEGKEDGI